MGRDGPASSLESHHNLCTGTRSSPHAPLPNSLIARHSVELSRVFPISGPPSSDAAGM